MYPHLFSGIEIAGLKFENRLTMAPLYLGYAGEGGTVSPMLLEHYRLMAQSGAAMVVVENCTVDFEIGSGSRRTLRVDSDHNLGGLAQLARLIQQEGALACLQLNHAGRFAHAAPEPVAPSAVPTFGRTPRALAHEEMDQIAAKFAQAAVRARKAGFDMVELHGGTGYLLAQFLSPHTNQRTDPYGGALENRQRFPLEVVARVQAAIPSAIDSWRMNGCPTVFSLKKAHVSPGRWPTPASPTSRSWAGPTNLSPCPTSSKNPKNRVICSTWRRP